MLPIVLLLFLVGLVYLYVNHKLNYWKNRNVPYIKFDLLFSRFYNSKNLPKSPAKLHEKLHKEMEGLYFGFYAGLRPLIHIRDPDLIKRVLVKDAHYFPNRIAVSEEDIDPLLCNSLFGIKEPNWKPLRRKLTPVFTSGKIKAMLQLMIVCSKDLVEYLNTNVNKSLEIQETIAKYTTDVITSCAFGIEANCFRYENSEFRVAGRQLQRPFLKPLVAFSYFFYPKLVKIFKFKLFDEEAATFLRNVFNETIKQREVLKIKRNDLIDILIELKNSETNDDEFKFYGDRLVAQAVVFFSAGLGTTSLLITFILHELCIHMEIQERLREEINETIDRFGEVSYEAVQDMKYLHMAICETLRKYPLNPFLIRDCDKDYKIPETGLIIEKGTPVLISQNGLHWDPKYFPNPEVYDPERFNPENKSKFGNQYVFLPFGDGPRNCIGERFALLASKLCVIQILRNFQVVRSVDTRDPLVFGPSGLGHVIPGIFVKFQKLDQA